MKEVFTSKCLLAFVALLAAAALHERSFCAAFVPPQNVFSSTSSPTSVLSTAAKSTTRRSRRWMSAVAEELSAIRHADQCPDDDPECITKPRGATNPWEVHKFGGASLATAELYRTVGDLLIREARGRGEGNIPTMA